jgi:hypothetical protein
MIGSRAGRPCSCARANAARGTPYFAKDPLEGIGETAALPLRQSLLAQLVLAGGQIVNFFFAGVGSPTVWFSARTANVYVPRRRCV